jgi:hypothetical protein
MSLKAIEMQVALPRTIDAAKLHEQQELRSQQINDQANEVLQKETAIKQQNVMKNEQSAQAHLLKDGQLHKHKNKKHHKEIEKFKENQKENHPYKGTMIDFNG